MNEQLDLFASRMARDKAIASVEANNVRWVDKAASAFEAIFRIDGPSFTGEQVRVQVAACGLKPSHHNAWGALMNKLLRSGRITSTGEYGQMSDVRSHARKTPFYMRVA